MDAKSTRRPFNFMFTTSWSLLEVLPPCQGPSVHAPFLCTHCLHPSPRGCSFQTAVLRPLSFSFILAQSLSINLFLPGWSSSLWSCGQLDGFVFDTCVGRRRHTPPHTLTHSQTHTHLQMHMHTHSLFPLWVICSAVRLRSLILRVYAALLFHRLHAVHTQQNTHTPALFFEPMGSLKCQCALRQKIRGQFAAGSIQEKVGDVPQAQASVWSWNVEKENVFFLRWKKWDSLARTAQDVKAFEGLCRHAHV